MKKIFLIILSLTLFPELICANEDQAQSEFFVVEEDMIDAACTFIASDDYSSINEMMEELGTTLQEIYPYLACSKGTPTLLHHALEKAIGSFSVAQKILVWTIRATEKNPDLDMAKILNIRYFSNYKTVLDKLEHEMLIAKKIDEDKDRVEGMAMNRLKKLHKLLRELGAKTKAELEQNYRIKPEEKCKQFEYFDEGDERAMYDGIGAWGPLHGTMTLRCLSYIGYIQSDSDQQAVFRDWGGNEYAVTVGTYVGDNGGQVIAVSPGVVLIRQLMPIGNANYAEMIVGKVRNRSSW